MQHPLQQPTGAEIRRLFHHHHPADHLRVGPDPAEAQARGHDLRERAHQESPRRHARVDRPRRRDVVGQLAIRVVLHKQQPFAVHQPRDGPADVRAVAHAGRVLEGRCEIDQLWPVPLRRRGQFVDVDALVAQRDPDEARLAQLERLDRAQVGGCFHQHHIARVQEDAGHEVERLLRAVRDQDVVGLRVDAAGREDRLRDILAERTVAFRRAVLQRGRRGRREHALHGRRERLRGKEVRPGQPAREREHLAPLRGAHDLAHAAGPQAKDAVREPERAVRCNHGGPSHAAAPHGGTTDAPLARRRERGRRGGRRRCSSWLCSCVCKQEEPPGTIPGGSS